MSGCLQAGGRTLTLCRAQPTLTPAGGHSSGPAAGDSGSLHAGSGPAERAPLPTMHSRGRAGSKNPSPSALAQRRYHERQKVGDITAFVPCWLPTRWQLEVLLCIPAEACGLWSAVEKGKQ